MKIIFLDLDGVINKHQNYPNGYAGMERDCVFNLNRILDAFPDLVIVVSSAWRYMFANGEMTRKGFEYLLLTGGVNCKHRIYGFTATDEEIPTRGEQITFWLEDHKQLRIEKFLVIDDLDFDFKEWGLPHLKTIFKFGLTTEDADRAINYFET